MPATPSASKKTPRRGANHGGEASKAARTVDRWATGGKASASAAGAAGPSVFNRLGPRRDEGSGEVAAAGWTLQKAAAEGGKAVEPERLSARDERVSRMGQERDDVMEEEDEGRRGPMEAADSAVDRGAAEATADKGRQESKPTTYRIPRKGREQGEEAALPAGGRKRRVGRTRRPRRRVGSRHAGTRRRSSSASTKSATGSVTSWPVTTRTCWARTDPRKGGGG